MKSLCFNIGFGIVMAWAWPVACAGGDSTNAVPDYSKGFAKFEAFGLPSVATAAYVKVTTRFDLAFRAEAPLPYDYPTSGNAWMLSETRDTNGQPVRGTFSVNGSDVLELNWFKGWRHEAPESLAPPSPAPVILDGEWRPANEPRDTKAIARFFRALDKEKDPDIKLNDEVRGRLFLYAFQQYQRGNRETANWILTELFNRSGQREAVMWSAINVVANGQYETLYRRFRTTHDWAAYRDGLTNLLARYTQGWQQASGVELLLDRVRQRMTNAAALPALTHSFTEADRRLAADMLGLRAVRLKSRYSESTILWLVPSSWVPAARLEGDADLSIRARGMAAIPFLLALAEDDMLTETDADVIRGEDTYLSHLDLNWRTTPESEFETMNRPATRGELAQCLLVELIPQWAIGDEFNRKKGAELLSAAQAFYAAHVRDSEDEMAVRCLMGRLARKSGGIFGRDAGSDDERCLVDGARA